MSNNSGNDNTPPPSGAKVVSIRSGEPIPELNGEINQFVIEMLEETLEAARSGEVIGVAISRLHLDYSVSERMTGSAKRMQIVGSLEYMKTLIIRSYLATDTPAGGPSGGA